MTLTRDEWLAARRTGIGGTDIAAILGLDSYRTPLQVYYDKMDLVPPQEENRAMRRGQRLESLAAEFYVEETGNAIQDCGFKQHPKYPHIIGTPDRLAINLPLVVEIKTVGVYAAHLWGESWTDQIPKRAFLQCQQYCSILDLPGAHVPTLFATDDFRIYHVIGDKELQEMMCEKGEQWWRDHIEAQSPPLPTGEKVDTELLKRIYKHSQEQIIPADAKASQLLQHYGSAKKTAEEMATYTEGLKNELKVTIGEATGLESAEFLATWKQDKSRDETDWKALADRLFVYVAPELKQAFVRDFTRTKDGARRFLFKEK